MFRKFLIGLFAGVFLACSICLVACNTNNESEWGNEYTASAAYQRATELGYTGTLEEFMASISGTDGTGITTVTINDRGNLVICLTTGTEIDLGKVVGTDGTGIQSAVIDSDGNLILTLSDGREIDLGKVVGTDGIDGSDGKDGVGIKSVTVNENGELVIINTNDEIIFQDKLPACVHNFSEWETGLEADCRTNGYEYRTCTKCGYTEYNILEILDHEWDEGTVVFEATCIANGLLYYTCENCGDTRTEIIHATGEHVFVNGTCKYCNTGRAEILDGYYNGDYGYNYLAKMTDGTSLQAFYNEIDFEVIKFHNNAEISATEITIDYAKYGISEEQAVAVWKTYIDDKPLYYWLSKTVTVSGDNLIFGVESEYTDGKTRIAYNEKLYTLIDGFSSVAGNEVSAYSLAFAYHDLIIDKIDYAYNGNVPETAAWAHNVTGVFEEKGAVCEGYARAFSLLLNMRGIENVFVTGVSNRTAHAWNLVKLDDGKWYWYDLTYDDISGYYWGISHSYFCVTDEVFLKNHTVDSSDNLGVSFLYALPARATAQYSGTEILYEDAFTASDIEYQVVGYNYASVYYITSGGNCVIPESVNYGNRNFTVVSIRRYVGYNYSVLARGVKFNSVSIPSTVKYIEENALRSYSNELEEINVDANNEVYRSVDGVLFTKSLYTLIAYPSGSSRTQYTIPDETNIIVDKAFECVNLELLKLGKNVRLAGYLNWSGFYPDSEEKGGNVAVGGWNLICCYMAEGGIIEVDSENQYFTAKDGMLFNKSLTYLYAAFNGTENAVIPETVTSMDERAFYSCRKLKSVELPVGLTNLSSFTYCVSLEEIVIPEGFTKIESNMFFGCTSLKRVVIPSSVIYIGGHAFCNCESLSEINIPASVSYIGEGTFSNCPAVITIADGNEYFVMRDGCLIELATKTIIKGSDSAIIPDDGSVEVIGNFAFFCCTEIETIIVPEQIHSIGNYAFGHCTSLKKLVIGSGVTSVGKSWIMNVYRCDIFVEFTEEQWKEIANDYDYTKRQGTYYFYSEEKPVAEGNFWYYSANGEIIIW